MMRRGAVAIFFTTTFMTAALAQSATQPTNMSEVAVGDHWTYELGEKTGKVVEIVRAIVTDISGDQVAIRVDVLGTDQSSSALYDKSWNILHVGLNRYSPNSGTGIQSPLKVNAEWTATAGEINDINSDAWILNVNSRVTGQESVTTKAGTFQSYTIETTQAVRSAIDPTAKNLISIRMWFSPEINRWVRRNTVRRREDGFVVSDTTIQLIEYGRKNTL